MILLFMSFLLIQVSPGSYEEKATFEEAFAIGVLVAGLSAGSFEEREEAFFLLQRFGKKAVPYLRAIQDRVDFHGRLKVDYLLSHPPVRQAMDLIPGGRVNLGTVDPYCQNPTRTVDLEPYFMDRYEVTNFMYYVFVRETDHAAPAYWMESRYPQGEENLPVTNVSYRDALAYAHWAGKRLPTVDEWEYAARGNDERLFPWGNQEFRRGKHANIDNLKTQDKPLPVGTFLKDQGPWGMMDMAGNVSEWVVWPAKKGGRLSAAKGSAFKLTVKTPYTYAAYKPLRKPAGFKAGYLGFRCARGLEEAKLR